MGKIYIEKFKIETNKNINKRIVLLSDIHHSNHIKKKFYDKILNKIRESKPDYIVIAGDVLDYGKVIDNKKVRETLEYFIKSLGEITNTIVTVGNHDLVYDFEKGGSNDKTLAWFSSLNRFPFVHYIYNQMERFNNLEFYHYTPSASWYRKWNKDPFYMEYNRNPLSIDNSDRYKILILHSPVSITKESNYKRLSDLTSKINLVLSGHMHNGAMPRILEFIDIKKEGLGLISPARKFFPKYSRGKHKIKNMDIVISRGITKIGKRKFLWIFNNFTSTDITIVDLD